MKNFASIFQRTSDTGSVKKEKVFGWNFGLHREFFKCIIFSLTVMVDSSFVMTEYKSILNSAKRDGKVSLMLGQICQILCGGHWILVLSKFCPYFCSQVAYHLIFSLRSTKKIVYSSSDVKRYFHSTSPD